MVRAGVVIFIVSILMLSAGCIKGGNFVYSKGKTLSPGKELEYPFTGPVNLSVKITSNIPVEVKIMGGGSVLKDFGETTKVDAVVPLPEGKWEVVIKNTGNETAKLDIELRGS
ncbi:MAG TPA: hypothetical protein ENH81_06450 [Thermococcus sp.]|nr:hypothetical protein [Thermococcus sp.]